MCIMSEKKLSLAQNMVMCPKCIKNDIYSELINYSIDLRLQVSLCPKMQCTYPFGTGRINEFFVDKKEIENENLSVQEQSLSLDSHLVNETLFKVCKGESKVEHTPKISLTSCQNEVGKEAYFLHNKRNQGQDVYVLIYRSGIVLYVTFTMILSVFKRCATQCYGLHLTKVPTHYSMTNDLLKVPQSCFTLITRNKSDNIPAPPVPPTLIDDVAGIKVEVLNALGEPTLSSLGLASWYPCGLVQAGLESIHVGLNVPWWSAIIMGTVVIKLLTLPLMIHNQRYAASLSNHTPQLKILQQKFERAKRSNNSLELSKAASNLQSFITKNNIKPLRNITIPLIQAPIFLSAFVGIRQMANLPVESMTHGGILWFTDLTTADPFFILPLVTIATFTLTAELGMQALKTSSANPKIKWLIRVMPLFALPFTLNFPSCILLYWLASNGVTLTQTLVMKSNAVRKLFKIPLAVKQIPVQQVASEKIGLVQSVKNNFIKSRVVVNVEDRMRKEAVKFKEAGMGAIPKTYSYNPTKK